MKLRITVEGKVYDVAVEVLEGQAGVPGPLSPVGPTPPPPVPAPAGGGAPLPARPAASPSAQAGGGGGAAGKGAASCVAPLAGTITKVLVKVGDSVEANAPLLVMEAMKMESTIASPTAGRVAAIKVAPGDAVKDGEVLVEFA
jgi:biotin carboxyl carrier protein